MRTQPIDVKDSLMDILDSRDILGWSQLLIAMLIAIPSLLGWLLILPNEKKCIVIVSVIKWSCHISFTLLFSYKKLNTL